MRKLKMGRFAITAIVGVLSAISGYATAQYIKSKENDIKEKEDFERITDHGKDHNKQMI